MNDLGTRLKELARNATTGVALVDPSLAADSGVRQRRGRTVALGVAATLAAFAMLFLWQGRDSGSTSVVAAEGEEPGADFLQDGRCENGPILELLRAGIPTYDYDPAGSFDALANRSTVVVAGQVEAIARAEVSGRSYIEISVAEVVDVAFDSGADTPHDGTPRDDIRTIAYEAEWADNSAPDPLAIPLAVDGLDFFAFLSPYSGIRGGWAPGPEGLYVSCNGPAEAVIANGAGPNDPTDPGLWWAAKSAEQAAGQAMADAAEAARIAAEAARLEAQREAARAGASGEPIAPFFHTIENGDRLGSIAEKYNVTVDMIIRANPQLDPNLLIEGQHLRIPGAAEIAQDRPNGVTVSYVIQPGDTLGSISNTWTVSLEALVEANPGIDPTTLRVGQGLTIPPWGTGLDPSELMPDIPPQPATAATPEDLVGLQRAMIEAAREIWAVTATDSYRLSYTEFRPEGMAVLVMVTVENGLVSDIDRPANATGPVYTVDDLFDLALTSETVREFEFDQQGGYPTVVSVDPDSTIVGDEFALRSIEVIFTGSG